MSLERFIALLADYWELEALPRGIENWPDNCDPRQDHGGCCFGWEGYFNAYPAPWRFKVEVSDALPPNDVFNGVWYVPFVSRGGPFDTLNYELVLPGGERIVINKYYDLAQPPALASVYWDVGFDCSICSPPRFDGYGTWLDQPLPSDIPPDGTPAGDPISWPTPVHIEPRGWDTD